MKIKLDENLPLRFATRLKSFGHEVHTVYDEHLIGHADFEIWTAAQKESRFLITQDLDFSDSRRFAPGCHRGVLLMRLHSPSRENLIARIAEIFQTEDVNSFGGCFIVATERKVRILRPEGKRDC